MKEEILKQIATELGAVPVYDEYMAQVAVINSEKLRIGIMGGPKTSKTTVINALAGTKLPTSAYEPGPDYIVAYGTPATDTTTAESAKAGTTKINADAPWLKDLNAELIEIRIDIDADNANQIELSKLVSKCDICIYLMTATQAYNRTDALMLKWLQDTSIPTLAVLSRADTVTEFQEVVTYVRNCIDGMEGISLFENKLPLFHPDVVAPLQEAVGEIAKKANIDECRGNFANFLLGYALSRLYETCQGKIDECNEKIEKIKATAVERKNRLSDKSTEWMTVETEFRNRITAVVEKLRSLLNERKNEILRTLNHDVDMYNGDLKQFCDVEIPYRLENIMRNEEQGMTQAINQELLKVLQWLQQEVLKHFGCRITLTSNITASQQATNPTSTFNNITDSKKLKVVVTVGRVATVLAGGLLLTSAAIPGITIGIAAIAGLGTELFMRKRSSNDKLTIKNKLPEIVDQIQSKTIVEFNDKIQTVATEIIEHLNTLKSEWVERETSKIEQEETIAVHNFAPTKWEGLMAQINQLCEIVLK